jgi:hypothetical protein
MATWTISERTLRVIVPPEPSDGNVVVRAVREAIEDPAFRPGLALLVDARQDERATFPEIAVSDVRYRAASISRLGFKICALVLPPASTRRNLATSFATFAAEHGMRTAIFEDLARAEAWLANAPQIGADSVSPHPNHPGAPIRR